MPGSKHGYKSCVKCLLPIDCHHVPVDGQGICAYCRSIEQYQHQVARIGCEGDILGRRLGLFQDRGQYDCVVGFSGGKDSSYVLYRLKEHYRARVLAYTCDNGFLTPYAKDNIERLTQNLGVDHVWVRPPAEVLRELYRAGILMEAWPCSACFHILGASAYKLAYQHRIPFIISGRTPEQILRNPTPQLLDGNDSLIAANFSEYDRNRVRVRALKDIEALHEIKQWLLRDTGLWVRAAEHLYVSLEEAKQAEESPELLAFFLYEPYDEKKIVADLEKYTSWQAPDDRSMFAHADCRAHEAAGYLYQRTAGTPFLSLELSASIRLGRLSREDWTALMEKEKLKSSRFPPDSIAELARICAMRETSIRLSPIRVRAMGMLRGLRSYLDTMRS